MEKPSGVTPTVNWRMDTSEIRRPKRPKTALACQRCKSRKQKCDGERPSCISCSRLSIKCEYIVSLVPQNGEKKLYIKVLENRIAELESSLAAYGHQGAGEDHWGIKPSSPIGVNRGQMQQPEHSSPSEEPRSDEDDDPLIRAVRDLSLSASGHYVGGTSTLTIGRMLSSVVNSQKAHPFEFTRNNFIVDPSPKSVYTARAGEFRGYGILSPVVADRLLQGFMKHIATRYPVLHTPYLKYLHENRNDLQNVYEKSMLHLVYATGGRWIESTGEMGNFFSDQHYEAAVENLDSILEMRDSHSLNFLILMAVYCLRAPRDPGAWTHTGLAMRLCIELGLHRRQKHRSFNLEGELDKRRFWSCYFLDRDISIALGRPPAISDHDIDTELPLDVDEACDDIQVINQAGKMRSDVPRNPPTTLTSFVHRVRLKRIESKIQHLIYRVDRPLKVPDNIIQSFLTQLTTWKDTLPAAAYNVVDSKSEPFDGIDIYMVSYYRCIRLLLYPQLTESPVNIEYLRICAEACGGVCIAYKRLHHKFSIGFSTLSIQSVFLAGLTLVYCAWLVPSNTVDVTAPLTDCSIILYVMTERWPSARKYRDIFEQIKTAVIDLIAQGRHQPLKAVDLPEVDMMEAFASLDQDRPSNIGEDVTQMLSQMTGQSVDCWGNRVDTSAQVVHPSDSNMYQEIVRQSGTDQYVEDFSKTAYSEEEWGTGGEYDFDPPYISFENNFT